MESLSETRWDVVINGTGLQQSLLALSLSRSDKKILHVDKNPYYGGADAAFSLQEAEEWAQEVNKEELPFLNASVTKSEESDGAKLAHSRSYTLSLSPQIIYARSKLLSYLVSSKVYRQLEFQAVGAWWLYSPVNTSSDSEDENTSKVGQLKRVPNGREDVFTDKSIDLRSKRSLMKFLKFVVDYENQSEVWESHAEEPISDFLSSQFRLSPELQTVMLALTLSLDLPQKTTVRYSLPRIARHLTSIGTFGPGFGAVIPKWGGGSEIAQVACRAGAVGGGVYVLGTDINSISQLPPDSLQAEDSKWKTNVALSNGETVRTALIAGSSQPLKSVPVACKSVTIVSSSLEALFATTVEGAPSSSVSTVVFPSNSLTANGKLQEYPVYVMAHSSDTGECPVGQCILYSTTLKHADAQEILDLAVDQVLKSTDGEDKTKPLFTLRYEQYDRAVWDSSAPRSMPMTGLDLAFDDSVLDHVEQAWRETLDPELDSEPSFLKFDDREGVEPEDDE